MNQTLRKDRRPSRKEASYSATEAPQSGMKEVYSKPQQRRENEGLENVLNNLIYEKELLMLFLLRGLKTHSYFRLYSNLSEARSFEDLVYAYSTKEDENVIWSFLQVTLKNEITISDLLPMNKKTKNFFNLTKYFISFCEIKKSEQFKGELKDFVIITNAEFNPKKIFFFDEESFFEGSDLKKILYFGKGEKEFRFRDDKYAREKIQSALEIKKQEVEKKIQELKSKTSKRLLLVHSVKLADLNDVLDKFETYFQDFLQKFRLVVNYPDKDVLGRLLEDEFKEYGALIRPLLSTIFDADSKNMFQPKCILKKGSALYEVPKNFISPDLTIDSTIFLQYDVEDYLRSLCRINPRVIEIQKMEIKIERELTELKNFLQETNKNRIFHFITGEKTTLSTIRVYQTLVNLEYVFINLKDLPLQKLQETAVKAFEPEEGPNVLVIECQKKFEKDKGEEVENLCERLLRILQITKLKRKKIILIAQKDDFLAKSLLYELSSEFTLDKTSFKDLDSESKNKILEKMIKCQNKYIKLKEWLNEELAEKVLNHGILSRLLEQELSVGDEKVFNCPEDAEKYYIPRTLYFQRIKTDFLNKNINSTFKIRYVAKESPRGLIEIRNVWDTGDQLIYNPVEEKTEENKDDVMENKNQYSFEYRKGFLFWKGVKGNSSAIQKYSDYNFSPDESINPENIKEKTVIVAGCTGCGKSTFLTVIAQIMKNNDPALWIVRINLNAYPFIREKGKEEGKSLKEREFKEIDDEEAIEYLSEMAIPDDCINGTIKFQRDLFKEGLRPSENKIKPKIVLFFDGFDEMWSTYRPQMAKLIKFLQKTSSVSSVWITTSFHEKDYLETELETPAYVFKPLTKDEQVKFLEDFWELQLIKLLEKEKNSSNLYKIYENLTTEYPRKKFVITKADKIPMLFCFYAENILKKWEASVTSKKNEFQEPVKFNCLPLHLKMLGEVIFADTFQPPQKYDVAHIYDKYVEMKLREKLRIDYQNLALSALFPQQTTDQKPTNDFLKDELVILNGGKPEFVHFSFAEYFLSEYLVANLKTESVKNILLDKVLMEDKYDLTRQFFNAKLKERDSNKKIFQAILKTSVEKENPHGKDQKAFEDIAEILYHRFEENPGTFENLVENFCNHGYNIADEIIANCKNEDYNVRIMILVKWAAEKLKTEVTNIIVNNDASEFFKERNIDVIGCLLDNGMDAEYLIDPSVRYLLNSNNDDKISNCGLKLKDFNNDSNESIELSTYSDDEFCDEGNAKIQVRKELRSRLKPIMDELEDMDTSNLKPSSAKKIFNLKRRINGRLEENKNHLREHFDVSPKKRYTSTGVKKIRGGKVKIEDARSMKKKAKKKRQC